VASATGGKSDHTAIFVTMDGRNDMDGGVPSTDKLFNNGIYENAGNADFQRHKGLVIKSFLDGHADAVKDLGNQLLLSVIEPTWNEPVDLSLVPETTTAAATVDYMLCLTGPNSRNKTPAPTPMFVTWPAAPAAEKAAPIALSDATGSQTAWWEYDTPGATVTFTVQASSTARTFDLFWAQESADTRVDVAVGSRIAGAFPKVYTSPTSATNRRLQVRFSGNPGESLIVTLTTVAGTGNKLRVAGAMLY
jgi:hypothetical protein